MCLQATADQLWANINIELDEFAYIGILRVLEVVLL